MLILYLKANEILTKFNIYNFGGLVPTVNEFDIETAYKISCSSTFFAVVLPTSGNFKHIFLTCKNFTIKSLFICFQQMFLAISELR